MSGLCFERRKTIQGAAKICNYDEQFFSRDDQDAIIKKLKRII